VPHVHLTVEDAGGRTLPATAGAIYLAQRRVYAWVRVGRELLPRQAVFDTGAPACIFSWRVWEPFARRGEITWVAHPPAEAGRDSLPRIDVHGGHYPFRLGRIRLQLVDLDGRHLAPREVIVICIEDEPSGTGDPPHLDRLLLVGLADVMHGRALRLEASPEGRQWTATLSEP
jgi:hypothetical protein